MFKLKGKTIWLFTIIAIGLAGVGFYFYTSLTSLNKRVEESIYPQKRSNYLKSITLDINKLNNLYLIDSIKFSQKKVDTIIVGIEKNIDSIKTEFPNSTIIDVHKLDTIPKLLRSIQEEYLALQQVKENSQSKFINDLESLLREELAELNLSSKDSITIIKQITSEVYERSIDENENFTEVDVEKEKEKSRGFFQRIFGSSERSDEDELKRKRDSLAIAQKKSDKDTIVSTSIDTLLTNVQLKEPPEMKIISIFERIQRRRIQILDDLKDRETKIFKKNSEVNSYIENILKEILFEEMNAFNNSIEEFTEKSKSYLWKSGVIILVILLLGIFSIYIIIKDINKGIYYQKRLEDSERKALREVEEKQKFLSTMSHELRTPLTSIIGYTELLNDEDENVKAIKTASNYLYQMTNEILDMAKIKAGIIEIKNEAFNLNEVFEMIQSNFEPLIQNLNIKAIFKIPKEPVYLNSDRYRIQQVIYNLVHNAVKYTEEGFIKVGFDKIEKENKKVQIHIFIEDSGVGMTGEEQETIFKDYHQAGTHKNKMKGTGLGMGIVKNLVNKLGGKLQLTSEVDKGTKFEILFLLDSANMEQVQKNEELSQLPENVLEGKNVFVVDDDKLITRLYEKIFTKYGAKVTLMNNPKSALEHLMYNRYDLVIFDMKMPEMTGSELLDELRENGVKLTNSVICTANVLLSEQDKANFEKFDFQLFKPFKTQDIIKLLTQIFQLNTEDFSEKTENSTSQVMQEEKFSYNLEDLKAYTGEDEEALMEMLSFLLKENTTELDILEKALKAEDLEETANRIHKLSSRFAQLNITPPKDPKKTELSLRDGNASPLTEANEIFAFWMKCNQFLIEKYII